MKTRLIYLFSITATLLITSCSEDDDANMDTQAPEISIADPVEEEEIAPGGEIHFDAIFTDNVELASFKLEVHNSFDDHTHASVKQSESENNPWSYNEVFEIEAGNTIHEAHMHIPVPAEINGQPISEGHYHFGVFVTDTAGNESQAFLELHIEGEEDHDDHEDEDHDHDH
ncbi:hypothetical protein APR41_01385 [Salegentibacter salinarum]|uniref:DUF4625 domain-containing protein n=1 Tax=Salegentibacter salinarum TaxID=447422 RepID=A0A2N0U433_9FLAO|nr:DUF4625 domain-containing protein [Salegentibacter salinarum]PKD21666.1 hypothetical protein APR41_01385 [Salegentibacter salinarum]SKB35188.1 protein of unknown function [Salegentibacter salinarum]